MKYLAGINHVLLFVLGAATGLVKIFGLKADVEIFARLGFSYGATVAFGAAQLLFALLLLSRGAARLGAWLLAASFVVATLGLFVSRIWAFGFASLLFIAMALFATRRSLFARG
jgi:hypothetical protein